MKLYAAKSQVAEKLHFVFLHLIVTLTFNQHFLLEKNSLLCFVLGSDPGLDPRKCFFLYSDTVVSPYFQRQFGSPANELLLLHKANNPTWFKTYTVQRRCDPKQFQVKQTALLERRICSFGFRIPKSFSALVNRQTSPFCIWRGLKRKTWTRPVKNASLGILSASFGKFLMTLSFFEPCNLFNNNFPFSCQLFSTIFFWRENVTFDVWCVQCWQQMNIAIASFAVNFWWKFAGNGKNSRERRHLRKNEPLLRNGIRLFSANPQCNTTLQRFILHQNKAP